MCLDQNWLEPYKQLLSNKKILEIGCGDGRDTAKLLNYSDDVTAIDIDEDKVKSLSKLFPDIKVGQVDIREGLLFEPETFSVVLASLSLHYFTHVQTGRILKNIKSLIEEDSVMIVRVNSSKDENYGAVGYEEIESGLFNVNGNLKRFFAESDIHEIFGKGWQIQNLEEKTIDRYHKSKIVWEFVAKSV